MEIEERGGDQDRVVATAHYNLKSLGTSEIMIGDMLTILSTSGRLPIMSRQNPGNPQAGKSVDLETNLDPNSSNAVLFQGSRKEANEYLASVDGLRHLMENLVIAHGSSAKLIGPQRLMDISMDRLRKEFHRILSANVVPTMEPTDGDSSHGSSDNGSTEDDGSCSGSNNRSRNRNSDADEICEIDMMPIDAVLDLRSIAERLVAAGYGGECVRVYRLTRKPVIEGCLKRIGFEHLSRSDVRKIEGGFLDVKINKWIRTVRIAVRILFASEKRLCAEIFEGFNHHVRDSCFSEVVKEQMTKILGFGESMTISKRSTERLFKMLDMYETLSDLMPDIETVFGQESCTTVRTQASTILVRLGESAMGILTEFENAIHSEKSKAPIPGGTIHPLTRYVMNYLSFLTDYKEALLKIMANAPIDIPKALPDDLAGFFGDLNGPDIVELGSPTFALSLRMGWIIIILECKLDFKSSFYKDVAQSYLFLMNNLHYIVKKVKGSELLGMFGYGWLRKNQGKVRQYAANYERAAWMKVLNCLRDEEIHANGGISRGVSRQAPEDKFKGLNFAIEDTLRKHSGWMVPDVQLQEELRISIAEKMIPAYRSFSGSFRSYFESVRHSERSVKYTPEDLEAHLSDLFQSDPSSTGSRKS